MRAKWLGLLALLVSMPLLAATPDLQHSEQRTCHDARNLIPQLWRAGVYNVPPAVPPLMLAAAAGETSQALVALDAMHPEDARRWRQLALYTAASTGQSGTVDALLNHGAEVDAPALTPAFKPDFHARTVTDLEHHAPFSPKAIQGLKAAGAISNEPQPTSPAIYPAILCNDAATIAVLLRHHADPMRQPWPTRPASRRGADPFITAVASGDADIIRLLLDHGADPCSEDRRLADNWDNQKHHRRTPPTTASIGHKAGLPPALVQQLICHAPTAS